MCCVPVQMVMQMTVGAIQVCVSIQTLFLNSPMCNTAPLSLPRSSVSTSSVPFYFPVPLLHAKAYRCRPCSVLKGLVPTQHCSAPPPPIALNNSARWVNAEMHVSLCSINLKNIDIWCRCSPFFLIHVLYFSHLIDYSQFVCSLIIFMSRFLLLSTFFFLS